MKFLFWPLCMLILLLAPVGCNKTGEDALVFFNAIILENNQDHLLLEPEAGSLESRSADRIIVSVSNVVLFNLKNAEIEINSLESGDQVQIYYDGFIAESCPAQIRGCQKIILLETSFCDGNIAGDIVFENGFYRPDFACLPDEISDWIGYSLEIPAVQEKIYNGYRYVLVTEPSGGYDVKVKEVIELPDGLLVKIKSPASQEGEVADTVIAAPFDLVIVENNMLPLAFMDLKDPERHFMKVLGLCAIEQPIVASSEWIKIFSPQPGERAEGVIPLSGIASVFEGTVNYELLTESGNILGSGFTTATMGDWGYFEEEVIVPVNVDAGGLVLRLYSASGKDGSRMFVVDIPLE